MICEVLRCIGLAAGLAALLALAVVAPLWLAYQAWMITTPLGVLVLVPWLLIMFGGDDGFRGDISPW